MLQEVVSSTLLDYDSTVVPQDYLSMRQNYIETEDEFLQLGQYTYTGYFYDIGSKIVRNRRRYIDKKALYQCYVYLKNEQVKHTRAVYGLIDLLGDLGGVTEVIMLVFGFFLFPVSEHNFTIQATKKLFYASTSDNNLFL